MGIYNPFPGLLFPLDELTEKAKFNAREEIRKEMMRAACQDFYNVNGKRDKKSKAIRDNAVERIEYFRNCSSDTLDKLLEENLTLHYSNGQLYKFWVT